MGQLYVIRKIFSLFTPVYIFFHFFLSLVVVVCYWLDDAGGCGKMN